MRVCRSISSSLSLSSLIDPKSGLGSLQACGLRALKLRVCPLPRPLLDGVRRTVALPRALNSGIAIPSPFRPSSARFPARDFRPSPVCLSEKSFRLSGIARPKLSSSSSSSGSGERCMSEGETSRTSGILEDDSIPADRSSSSSMSNSSGEVRKNENGFSSIASKSSTSSRIRI